MLLKCSAILISGYECWRGTHKLEWCSAILVSGSDPLKHWERDSGTHILKECSAILISGSDLLKHWRGTHMLEGCSAILISESDSPQKKKTLERDSHAGGVFSHSCQ